MKSRLTTLLALAMLIGGTLPAANAAPDATTLLKESDQARGGGLPGITWEIRLVSRDGTRSDEPQRLQVKAIGESSVAETLEPVRSKGGKLLQVERNMWLSRPGLSKPIPISPRQRMSGQASNGDIAATNYAGDYDAQLDGEEAIDNEPCYVLNLTARNKRTTYDRIRYWVAQKQRTAIKAEFYSLSGKLIKTARFENANVIEHDGRKWPFVSRMTIRDALIDAETTMEYSAVRVTNVAPAEFDLGQLQ